MGSKGLLPVKRPPRHWRRRPFAFRAYLFFVIILPLVSKSGQNDIVRGQIICLYVFDLRYFTYFCSHY